MFNAKYVEERNEVNRLKAMIAEANPSIKLYPLEDSYKESLIDFDALLSLVKSPSNIPSYDDCKQSCMAFLEKDKAAESVNSYCNMDGYLVLITFYRDYDEHIVNLFGKL